MSLYLGASGTIRTLSAWFGDPRGAFVLSGIASAVAGAASAATVRARQSGRERLEGRDAPDVLRTGAWCGLDADYVVLSARRKPE